MYDIRRICESSVCYLSRLKLLSDACFFAPIFIHIRKNDTRTHAGTYRVKNTQLSRLQYTYIYIYVCNNRHVYARMPRGLVYRFVR